MSAPPNLADCRRLFLRHHTLPVQIGVHDFERLAAQRVVFEVDLWVPLSVSTPRQDDIAEVVDYDFIVERIAERVARGHIDLQETLCDDLLAALLAHPGVRAARVQTCKPDVYRGGAAIGCEVFGAKGVGSMSAVLDPSAKQAHQKAHEANKLSKRLHRLTARAITDFNMIEDGDRVMVCVSGGKDSYALLDILLNLRRRAPIRFELIAVNLDQKQPGFPENVLPEYLSSLDVPFHIERQDTYSIVKRLIPEGKTTCGLCSRLRRGILYRVAGELGATKIALGHHRDDILQTLFLNLFFGAKLKGMPPKLVSDDGRHIVIRPLARVPEADLERWAAHRRFPIIPCNLCGSQANLQRVQIGQMLRDWDKRFPGRIDNLFTAMGNVVPSHLMDRNLFDFAGLKTDGAARPDGDRAFDDDDGGDGSCEPAGAPLPIRIEPRRPPKET